MIISGHGRTSRKEWCPGVCWMSKEAMEQRVRVRVRDGVEEQ
ncbi:hypothetical protein SLEP1_g13250 [Rubroshorea leprosula]|nr:hypothetical protein SLEP1_g13250 [Rubroshorea leprosula]